MASISFSILGLRSVLSKAVSPFMTVTMSMSVIMPKLVDVAVVDVTMLDRRLVLRALRFSRSKCSDSGSLAECEEALKLAWLSENWGIMLSKTSRSGRQGSLAI
eukprot:CAMPEP_0113317852 /NCGR_PEP_ID=MMETSP0010_2-20120614/12620_1 /TAXON_ID=216773 ORGANISM="Corethron hystrix, Strain 308" /NCGR_SAMPLE_ID=MMETSP0010_2 /ASSEMBLY_ACC=CAM_ASM_000155 /LENGTH=103 /DNA_ID=CAMNT_0000174967 /DNA_START=428 /DNA_END=739 /DNA_ORIENTATION=- /assembly_acc=CAM_ASM_000155